MDIKFVAFSDLHYDHMHDGKKRLSDTIKKINDRQIEFAVNLGDLCNPTDANSEVL